MTLCRSHLRLLAVTVAVAFPVAGYRMTSVAHAAAAPVRVTLTPIGTTLPMSTQYGSAAVSDNEIDGASFGDDSGSDADSSGFDGVDRTITTAPGAGPTVHASQRAKSNPTFTRGFDGVNFFDQRFSNNGNQFSVEPPDQGLCVGNGFVVESANDVMRIFNTSGTLLRGPIALNTFYGYAPAINRAVSPLQFGPDVTDPSCYYDAASQRWFHLVLTLDRAAPTTQALSGANHLDLAVSNSPDPTGSWTVFSLPVQDDGTQGTPDHGCVSRVAGKLVHGPCLGDYPHIGADANGIYLTTNEFNLAAPGFRGAQIYAISKQALIAHAATVPGFQFDTASDPSLQINGLPGFTVWPATTPGTGYSSDNGGTEWMLSSTAVFSDTGTDSHLEAWSFTNTSALNSGQAPTASVGNIPTETYSVPPASPQKPGNTPLLSCIADPNCAPLVGSPVFTHNVEAHLPSNDSRMQQVVFADGKLWAALDTGLVFDSNPSQIVAGIAYFVLRPASNSAASVALQGYLGLPGDNLTYPAIASTASGRAVMAFTVVGPDYYPSAGYAGVDALVGTGPITVTAAGAGPQDGFSGYIPLSQNSFTVIRPRWGDYGAAVADGNTVWMSSEYIGQTCTYAQYTTAPLGQCGRTRGALGNWDTRITEVTP